MFWNKPYPLVSVNLEELATDSLRRAEDPKLVKYFESLDVILQKDDIKHSLTHRVAALTGPEVIIEVPLAERTTEYETLVKAVIATVYGKTSKSEDLIRDRARMLRTRIGFGNPREWQQTYTLNKIADYLDAYRKFGYVTKAALQFSNVPRNVYDKAVKDGLPLQEVAS